MLKRMLAAVSFLLLIGYSACAEEMVNNPDFANWSKFAKGTSVTRTWTSVEPSGRTSVVTETLTLMEVAADKVVLQVEYVSDVPGATKFKTKPESREILKSVPLPAGTTKEDFTTKLPGTVEVGKDTETVKVPSGEFKAKWFKTVVERNGNRREGKSWVSDEVPGRIVKAEEKSNDKKNQLSYTTVREIVEIKKP